MGFLNWRKNKIAPFSYSGGQVSRALLDDALEFLISLEPDPDSPEGMDEYEANCRRFDKNLSMADAAIRRFGEQIEPQTLEAMQNVYYSITNSPKYSSPVHCSVVSSSLNHCWSGIGPWQS